MIKWVVARVKGLYGVAAVAWKLDGGCHCIVINLVGSQTQVFAHFYFPLATHSQITSPSYIYIYIVSIYHSILTIIRTSLRNWARRVRDAVASQHALVRCHDPRSGRRGLPPVCSPISSRSPTARQDQRITQCGSSVCRCFPI